MITISQPASACISEFYKTDFKKLTLTNIISKTKGAFPVMVIKDIDQQFNGMTIVGPGMEKTSGNRKG